METSELIRYLTNFQVDNGNEGETFEKNREEKFYSLLHNLKNWDFVIENKILESNLNMKEVEQLLTILKLLNSIANNLNYEEMIYLYDNYFIKFISYILFINEKNFNISLSLSEIYDRPKFLKEIFEKIKKYFQIDIENLLGMVNNKINEVDNNINNTELEKIKNFNEVGLYYGILKNFFHLKKMRKFSPEMRKFASYTIDENYDINLLLFLFYKYFYIDEIGFSLSLENIDKLNKKLNKNSKNIKWLYSESMKSVLNMQIFNKSNIYKILKNKNIIQDIGIKISKNNIYKPNFLNQIYLNVYKTIKNEFKIREYKIIEELVEKKISRKDFSFFVFHELENFKKFLPSKFYKILKPNKIIIINL